MTSRGGRQRPDRDQLGGRISTGSWGYEATQASVDRDDALRAARPVVPSTSTSPRRCACCRQWGVGPDVCRDCGETWTPAPLVGLDPVR